ncbi:Serine/threonine-protein kinase sepA [Auxenochlorella protothecoides]|uniref:Serine/threonine-protein kinase sepA n=1 Tax=Auxenochlorella protothecoides TaxID=3075 RepID=A0A087SMS6_AUXPR|nr:Serine/threonine-protein kinase sepA [Auxenochlorella protothecoides]KFM27030.1 Serine/threonine-protein kinase sepA [Auxenochlorella protothecoides]
MYAAMVLGDGVVKAALVQRAVLAPLFEVTAFLPPPLALTVVSAVRALTVDPTTLGPLADASGVAFLVAQLARAGEPLLQDQALSALHRMAAADRARQEQAAVAGAVPFLCQLGILPQRGADEACQVEVLDALAAWLAADAPRIEARLAAGDAQTRLVTLVPVMSTAGEGDALCALLVPLQRLLSLSPRMARELAQNGLVPRVTELLRRPTSPTTLPALDVLATLVAAAAQPRALAARFRLAQVLVPLAGQAGMQPGVAEKVAQLLQAIRG